MIEQVLALWDKEYVRWPLMTLAFLLALQSVWTIVLAVLVLVVFGVNETMGSAPSRKPRHSRACLPRKSRLIRAFRRGL